jgi:hypothetical protein
MSDKISNSTKEDIFDAVRHLAPDELHTLFSELAAQTKQLADEYDNRLAGIICS